MKTGFAKICINPPYGAPICGYYEARHTKGILDDLYVRAAAFEDGGRRAAVIALDIILLPQSYYDAMKEAICSACGMDKDSIFINCSHTHTGPLVGKDFAFDESSSEAYDKFLISCVRDAVIYALQDMRESEIEVGEGEAKNVSFVRRYRMKDGSVATNPGVENENILHPLGKPNESVKLIKIIREDSRDIFIVNFGTHPDSVGGEYISADYMGYVCGIIENAVANTDCMFLQGAQGDVNHVNVAPCEGAKRISVKDFDGVPRSIELAEHMGRVIAGAVLSIASITEKVSADGISYASKTVQLPSHRESEKLEESKRICKLHEEGRTDELPYKEMELTTVVAEAKRIVRLQNGPDFFPFHLSAVKIGEVVFAGIGGEPFTEIGNRICAASPFKKTVMCALTNSEGGYIPTASAYSEGGYEARSSELSPESEDIVVFGMSELLKSL